MENIEERQILANQIVNKYDDDAKILIEQAEQATQEAVRWKQVADNTRKVNLHCLLMPALLPLMNLNLLKVL
jgi:hypothetical protein